MSVSPRVQSEGVGAVAIACAQTQAELALPPSAGREPPLTASPPLAPSQQHLSAVSASCGVVLHVHSDLSEIADEWREFERHADHTAFQAFDWIAKWQRHIGARNQTHPAIVLGRDREGRVIFIFHLAIEARRGARYLGWFGSKLCDYNAPLLSKQFADHVKPEQFARLWADIVALLNASPHFSFDVVDLQKMPEAVGTQKNPFVNLAVASHPSGAYVAELGADWDQYYADKRSASTRKRERRQLKHLAEHGAVKFVNVQERADIERTLNTLFAQKSHSFGRMGVKDIFENPGYREFYLDVATDPATRSLIHVSRLDVGSDAMAANIGLTLNDCYYLILSSYQDGELARFGPGRAHLNELLRYAIGRGFRHFDFTIGDEPYKRDWCDTEKRLFDHLAAASPRGALMVAMAAAFRSVKRFIKQTPALWEFYRKLRGTARRTLAALRVKARAGDRGAPQ